MPHGAWAYGGQRSSKPSERWHVMNRRSFLAATAGSAALAGFPAPLGANLPGEKGLRLSVTWWLMGKMPVGEALATLVRHGYDAFEMFDWRDPALLETFVAEKRKYPSGLRVPCSQQGRGGARLRPGESAGARRLPAGDQRLGRSGEENRARSAWWCSPETSWGACRAPSRWRMRWPRCAKPRLSWRRMASRRWSKS